MKSGKLRHVIRLERVKAGALDDYGTPDLIWETTLTLRAELVSHAAADLVRGDDGERKVETVVFRVRAVDGVNPLDRIVWRNTPYLITGIDLAASGRALELKGEAV